jgi:hypothetical protein
MLTVFLAPIEAYLTPFRQPDGVVTHSARAPYHMLRGDAEYLLRASGYRAEFPPTELPRGQQLIIARPV